MVINMAEKIYIMKVLATQCKEPLTTKEISKMLNFSQQSASRWLILLENENLIKRYKEGTKEVIKVTSDGMALLEHEYIEYKKLFNGEKMINFKGKVSSGLGEGTYYITRKEYLKQFEEKLNIKPFPGTFNVKIPPTDEEKLKILYNTKGIEINGFVSMGRSFGKVYAFKAMLNNIMVYIIIPERSHYKDVLEIISNFFLREKLNVKDGDTVSITVYIGE